MVIEADDIKLIRDGGPYGVSVGVPKSGVKPHPIRKKAFHRALKRGELWAVIPHEWKAAGGVVMNLGPNKFAKVVQDIHCPKDQAYIMWPIEYLAPSFSPILTIP